MKTIIKKVTDRIIENVKTLTIIDSNQKEVIIDLMTYLQHHATTVPSIAVKKINSYIPMFEHWGLNKQAEKLVQLAAMIKTGYKDELQPIQEDLIVMIIFDEKPQQPSITTIEELCSYCPEADALIKECIEDTKKHTADETKVLVDTIKAATARLDELHLYNK